MVYNTNCVGFCNTLARGMHMKAILRLLLGAVVLGVFVCGSAYAAEPSTPEDLGFTISDYDVHAVVSEDNVYSITETIKVHFTQAKHGIYRTIPVNKALTRQGSNGQSYTTKVKTSVYDVKVQGWKYSVKSDSYETEIKIGDANKTVTGDRTYAISYKLRFGDDGVDAFDEAYFNIIGTDWDTTTDHVTFSVELPKPFDVKKLGFSVGNTAVSGYNPDELKYTVRGSTITGYTTVQLHNYFGITMRAELPQGYFKLPDPRMADWIIMGIIGLLAFLSMLLFLIFGIDSKPVQTVEFNAPAGMTPTDVGYIIDGCMDDRDVVSLLLYWADKGCIKIEDLGGSNFRLTKLKALGADAKDYEKYMFGRLFKKDSSVETDDLENTFYKTISSTKVQAESNYTGQRRLFTATSMRVKPWLGFMAIFPMILTLYLEAYRGIEDVGGAIVLGIFIGLAMLLPVFWLIHIMRTWKLHTPKSRTITLLIALALWVGAAAYFITHTVDNIHTQLPWVAVLGTTLISLCAVFIRKRTRQSAEWYAKIMAFREFIVLAERDRLVALVEQNPSYFYNVLPYAYVMNVTDKWAEKFESIAMQPPGWYSSMNNIAFNSTVFTHSLGSSMNTMTSSMTSAPSSGSSGGGGGGSGFSSGSSSGGGGGGGGGGSW